MKSKLMLMGAGGALLVSFACGCAAEMATDEGTSTDPKAGPADEKTGTTESPIIYGYGNPPGYNPPGVGPYNPPGYNPPGMGVGVYGNPPGYNPPGVGPYNPPGYNPPGTGVGVYPGWGMGYGGNLNGGWNVPGPY